MTCSAKRDAVVEAEDFERELYQRDATEADEREYLSSVGTPVGVRVGPHPMSALTVRFDAEVIDVLRERAGAEGVGVTQLVRAWVMERLAAPDEEGLPVEATEALASLRRVLQDAFRRAEILAVAEDMNRRRTGC